MKSTLFHSEPVTVVQVMQSVAEFKPLTRMSIYRQFKLLGIKPISEARQIPQLYPHDTATRILQRYGFK